MIPLQAFLYWLGPVDCFAQLFCFWFPPASLFLPFSFFSCCPSSQTRIVTLRSRLCIFSFCHVLYRKLLFILANRKQDHERLIRYVTRCSSTFIEVGTNTSGSKLGCSLSYIAMKQSITAPYLTTPNKRYQYSRNTTRLQAILKAAIIVVICLNSNRSSATFSVNSFNQSTKSTSVLTSTSTAPSPPRPSWDLESELGPGPEPETLRICTHKTNQGMNWWSKIIL